MANFKPAAQLVPSPDYPAWIGGALAQLPVHDVDGHQVDAGHVYDDDLVVTHGHSYSYAAPGDVQTVNKTQQEELALTAASVPFNIMRLDYLPTYAAGTPQDQETRALRRFAMWESYDVEVALSAKLDAVAIAMGTESITPEQGVAALLEAIARKWPFAPVLLTNRGPGVTLLPGILQDLQGAQLVKGGGFGPATNDGHARIYVAGHIELFRAEPTVAQGVDAAALAKNRIETLVEREYLADIFGPVYSIDVEYADASVS